MGLKARVARRKTRSDKQRDRRRWLKTELMEFLTEDKDAQEVTRGQSHVAVNSLLKASFIIFFMI